MMRKEKSDSIEGGELLRAVFEPEAHPKSVRRLVKLMRTDAELRENTRELLKLRQGLRNFESEPDQPWPSPEALAAYHMKSSELPQAERLAIDLYLAASPEERRAFEQTIRMMEEFQGTPRFSILRRMTERLRGIFAVSVPLPFQLAASGAVAVLAMVIFTKIPVPNTDHSSDVGTVELASVAGENGSDREAHLLGLLAKLEQRVDELEDDLDVSREVAASAALFLPSSGRSLTAVAVGNDLEGCRTASDVPARRIGERRVRRVMASGVPYSPLERVVSTRMFPLGTTLWLKDRITGRTTTATVLDRTKSDTEGVVLSEAVWNELGDEIHDFRILAQVLPTYCMSGS